MTKKAIAFTLLLVFILSSQAFCEVKGLKTSPGVAREMPHKIYAPDFKLLSVSGQVWRFNEYRGKIILLNFTTTWCPYCLKDIPFLKKLHARYKDRGFEFASIYVQESRKRSFPLRTSTACHTRCSWTPTGSIHELRGARLPHQDPHRQGRLSHLLDVRQGKPGEAPGKAPDKVTIRTLFR
jgi:thiol-disulfide isomerase/thioredoxin